MPAKEEKGPGSLPWESACRDRAERTGYCSQLAWWIYWNQSPAILAPPHGETERMQERQPRRSVPRAG